MSFSIRFLDPEEYSADENAFYFHHADLCLGRITIGNFEEIFESSVSFWSKADYYVSWMESLNRIIRGATISCLITSLHDPRHAEFLNWWPLYRDDQLVFIQNHLFFLNEARAEFDLSNPYAFVRNHQTVNEDGESISQWTISVEEIRVFLQENKGRLARG